MAIHNSSIRINLPSYGTVVSVRGSVIDAHFPQSLPKLYSELKAGDDNSVVLEVVTHLNSEMVRGIALTPTSFLSTWLLDIVATFEALNET